jgi:transposase InsO family protein
MTEIETGEGKIYLATVIDAFSRRCLGYAIRADSKSWGSWKHAGS